MGTPIHIREASLKKRQRVCVICGAEFVVRNASIIGRACSKPCASAHQSRIQSGRIVSDETRAKRSASLKAKHADPEFAAKWRAKNAAAVAAWHSNPDNATAFAKRSSERMKKRHGDPEWQKVRNERSSRTMKKNWETYRDLFTAQSAERYIRNIELGRGINTGEAEAKKRTAAKWIMKQAQAALHTETDYNEVYAAVQAKLRREIPYDGPQGTADYFDYLRKLGSLVTNSPECREIADGFLSTAIPRFAEEWRKKNKAL